MIRIEITKEIYQALKIPRSDIPKVLKIELAFSLYQQESLS